MQIIESTFLWKRTLADGVFNESPTDKLKCQHAANLRESFKSFRKRVNVITGEISRSFRDLTVHDIEHIDALWQCADIILGADFSINPAEAYVLGGAFLLHDAGLALASYQDVRGDVEGSLFWRDCVAIAFLRQNGRSIRGDDFAALSAEIKNEANELFLRQHHAEHAAALAFTEFRAESTDVPRFLIDDADLRDAYGHITGRIAYSHWWPIEKVVEEFAEPHGAFAGGPPEWQIDTLTLALILRTCDAIQIDSLRAPAFLRSLRKPTGVADQHWKFQEKMMSPYVENGAIFFTSNSPFKQNESEAWWTGKELLQLADNELRSADACLADAKKTRFLANRVAGVPFHKQLVRLIKVDGWMPVDTSVHVSDVSKLVETLGGQGLYGDRPYVPLRELLQNARDAIVARRIEESRPDDWGQIKVTLENAGTDFVLSVSDNGVGMSAEVLAGHLLDFGKSYWTSQHALQEHPGLASQGFEPTGKFGIGFFSVFMIASSVRVISRQSTAAKTDTRVLEFLGGLRGRIILRDATPSERLVEPGTCVELRLNNNPKKKGGFLGPGSYSEWPSFANQRYQKQNHWTLKDLCVWLAPALDVSLTTADSHDDELTIVANDWKSIHASELVRRLLLYRDDVDAILDYEETKRITENISPLISTTGETIGRAAIAIHYQFGEKSRDPVHAQAEITAGQFRSHGTSDLCGLLIGCARQASRNSSTARAFEEGVPLVNWATAQAKLARTLTNDRYSLYEIALLIRSFGGQTGDLPIFRDAEGFKSFNDVAGQTDLPNQLELVADHWSFPNWNYPELKPGQLGVSSGRMRKVHEFRFDNDPLERSQHPTWNRFWMSPWGAAIEAVTQAWRAPLNEVLGASTFRIDETLNDGTIMWTTDTLVKPRTRV